MSCSIDIKILTQKVDEHHEAQTDIIVSENCEFSRKNIASFITTVLDKIPILTEKDNSG